MKATVFINIAVNDLGKSRQFFSSLGYSFNEAFSDDTAACLTISESISIMLLTRQKMAQFTKKEIIDSHKATETLIALSSESRGQVDQIMSKALANGGTESREKQDHGFMYGRSFEDLDGHIFELVYMDMSQMPKAVVRE